MCVVTSYTVSQRCWQTVPHCRPAESKAALYSTAPCLVLKWERSTVCRSDLDVSAASDLGEVFLALQRLVNLVVGNTEDADPRLSRLVPLGKHDELGHERDQDRLAVQLGRHPRRLADVLTVHQPKSAHPHTLTCNIEFSDCNDSTEC